METEDIMMNAKFDKTDFMAELNFEMCIENGHYQFILRDRWGDGIKCLNSGLQIYNIYINDVLSIPGQPFEFSQITHEFLKLIFLLVM